MKNKKAPIVIGVALFTVLACNLGTPTPAAQIPAEASIATSVALTLQGNNQAPLPLPTPGAALPTPQSPALTTVPPTVASTPTITQTPTPTIPMISVSIDTNCRTGPGKAYDAIGALMVGETAEVTGKNTPSDYWIIQNPDRSGTCWLWGQYAAVNGDTNALPEMPVPPTPTPAIPAAPSNLTAVKICAINGAFPNYSLLVTLKWKDNASNESGFRGYRNGAFLFETGPNEIQISDGGPAIAAVPVEYAISAVNAAGESARTTIQVTCP